VSLIVGGAEFRSLMSTKTAISEEAGDPVLVRFLLAAIWQAVRLMLREGQPFTLQEVASALRLVADKIETIEDVPQDSTTRKRKQRT
jgi:hypothetical protein